jgi:hypothetical protein
LLLREPRNNQKRPVIHDLGFVLEGDPQVDVVAGRLVVVCGEGEAPLRPTSIGHDGSNCVDQHGFVAQTWHVRVLQVVLPQLSESDVASVPAAAQIAVKDECERERRRSRVDDVIATKAQTRADRKPTLVTVDLEYDGFQGLRSVRLYRMYSPNPRGREPLIDHGGSLRHPTSSMLRLALGEVELSDP